MRKWFNNLKVAQKLMLISFFFVMPDSIMLYLFITGINQNIQFARWEQKGNAYQRPLETLLKLIPRHQLLAGRPPGNSPSDPEPLLAVQAEIDAAFVQLADVDARIGADLQFTDEGLAKRKREHCRVGTVHREWLALKGQLASLDSEARAAPHRHLIADVRTMITHAGDLSNLILDPDLDSYYLMDASLLALPEAQDRLAVIMAAGQRILEQNPKSAKEREQLAIWITLFQDADLKRVSDSLQTALNEDPNFYGRSATLQTRVPPALLEFTAAATAFNELTTRLVRSDEMEITAVGYVAAGEKARAASFKLWQIAAAELDTLLQMRIEAYEQQRTRSLLVSALALLAACGFVTFITRSISGPLRRQAAELTAANECLRAEIAERNRAEAELKSSAAQLATAQTIARMGSWEWDVRTGKLLWSDENFRIHGLQPGERELGFETTFEFIHPTDRGSSRAAIERALQDGKPFNFEHRVLCPDGAERIIQQRGDLVIDGAGRPAKLFGTAQDITARKQAEAELAGAQKELIETSRQAGMAEVATGVLHNVGNVLNSVNVASSCLAEGLRKSKVVNLARVVALFREHEADLGDFLTQDPKGRQVPGYLAKLSGHLAAEQSAARNELAQLQKNIEHIKDIVSMQQNFAKVPGVKQTVSAADLLEDALRMNISSIQRHDVQVLREYEPAPPVVVEKHKALQILVNLICNAKQSCEAAGRETKQLNLRVRRGAGEVRISVTDNGVGIPPENLARIFNHGFTTKQDGHGFGLHSAANAAREMGGSLRVDSEGAGCGATFTLELPLEVGDRNRLPELAEPMAGL